MKVRKKIFLLIPMIAIIFMLSFILLPTYNSKAETITDDNFYTYEYYGLDDFRSYNPYTFHNLITTVPIFDLTHSFRTLAINPTLSTTYYDNLNINNSELGNNEKSTTVYLKTNTYYFIKVNYIMADTLNAPNSYELFIHNRSWSSQIRYQLYNFVEPLPNYDFNYNRIYLFNTSIFDNKDYYYDNGVLRQVQTYTVDNTVYYPFIISNSYADYFTIDFSIYEVLDFPLDYFSGLDTGVQISYSTNPDYESAYLSGKEYGYNHGYVDGYNNGADYGYNRGLSDGEVQGYSNKGFLANSIDNLNALFSVNIFGDLTVGNFIFICFSILAFFFLLKFIIR